MKSRIQITGNVVVPLLILAILLLIAMKSFGQSFPRWPQGQTVRIYTLANAFTDKEHARINSAVESWRPLLPSGITLTLAGETSHTMDCQGCVTINRSPVRKERWGEAEPHSFNDVAWYAIIRIDPRVGSGDAFQHTVEHEIGHALGLDDVTYKSVMNPQPSKRAPNEKDGRTLQALYYLDYRPTASSGPIARTFGPVIDVSAAARSEAATMLALQQHGFKRTVSIQTLALDDPTIVTGTYERISRMVLADNGGRYEKVISKHSHLKDLKITKADEEDFSGAQMGLIDFADYRFTAEPVGIRVTPLNLNGRRFSGIVLIGDKGIYRLFGTTLPQKSERFPTFMAVRKEVDGHMFPSEASGEGVLVFPSISIKVRWSVRESDYYRFGSRVTVKEVE